MSGLAPQPPGAIESLNRLVDGPSAKLAAGWLLSFENDNTRSAYQRDLIAFATWLHEHRSHYGNTAMPVTLASATRQELDAYARSCEQTLSRSTVARRLSSLASLFEYAVDEQVLTASPASRVRRPKVDRTGTTIALTRREAAGLVAAAQASGPRDAVLVGLLLHNGLRVTSALALRWTDVRPHGALCLARVTAKGGKVLDVPLTPSTCAALDELRPNANTEGRVLLANDGTEMDRHDATRTLARLARAAGIEQPSRITPHTLRATFATVALKHRGLHVVQQALGHSDPATTTRYNRASVRPSQHPAFAVAADLDGVNLAEEQDDEEE